MTNYTKLNCPCTNIQSGYSPSLFGKNGLDDSNNVLSSSAWVYRKHDITYRS